MGPPAVSYTVRFLDGAGRTQLYGSVAGAYTNPEGEVVRPSDGEREAFFGALCARYAGEAGVERATITPLRTPAGARADALTRCPRRAAQRRSHSLPLL